MEQYKEIPFAENYLVSNLGNVKSKRYNKPLKGFINNSGYKRVQIGYSKNKHFIHRLVAETFLKKEIHKNFVNHKDGNKLNNSVPYERIGRQIRIDPARFNFTTIDAGETQNVVIFSPSKKGVRSSFAEGL